MQFVYLFRFYLILYLMVPLFDLFGTLLRKWHGITHAKHLRISIYGHTRRMRYVYYYYL